MFDRDLKKFQHNIAFIEDSKNISYLELVDKIKKFQKLLPQAKQLIAIEMEQTL
jgi:hypothetical protein